MVGVTSEKGVDETASFDCSILGGGFFDIRNIKSGFNPKLTTDGSDGLKISYVRLVNVI